MPAKEIEASAMDLMLAYDWPGNVRELENLIFRLVALSPDTVISHRDIERELRAVSMKELSTSRSFESEIDALLHKFVMGDLLTGGDEGGKIHQSVLEQVERPLIRLALSVTSGNKLRTASLLGVNRNTLRARINALGISDE